MIYALVLYFAQTGRYIEQNFTSRSACQSFRIEILKHKDWVATECMERIEI